MKSELEKHNNINKDSIYKRLNIIEGQVSGVKKMIEDNRNLEEVLVQIQSINNALKSLSDLLLDDYSYNLLVNECGKGNFDTIDKLSRMYKKFK